MPFERQEFCILQLNENIKSLRMTLIEYDTLEKSDWNGS